MINHEWHLNLETYDGSWEDLCNYLYSPTMIAEIRNKVGVNIRARDKGTTRKGIESVDKKKFVKIIENKKRLLGKDFSISAHEEKIKMAKKNMEIKKNLYDEGKWLLDHAIANNDEKVEELSNAVEVLRNKYNYAKKQYERACTSLTKKKEALDIIREYEQKLGILNEMMEETRSGEELSILEQEETIQAIRNQKKEKQIPYYTWRFVCDKITDSVAAQIEKVLEDNLNKGSGINGEDGYINVTSFPMERSREFFVDYPKNSNLFRAFRKKGIELSNVLIEGVARHLKTSFVHCKGETFINSPMEKTMSGDMLEWVGL
jgi:transcription initiation factor IIE alpha subunit